MIRLFVEDSKGHVSCYDNVYKVKIEKKDNKNVLRICYNNCASDDYRLLRDVSLCYLIDVETMHEYFRYEK